VGTTHPLFDGLFSVDLLATDEHRFSRMKGKHKNTDPHWFSILSVFTCVNPWLVFLHSTNWLEDCGDSAPTIRWCDWWFLHSVNKPLEFHLLLSEVDE